MARCEHVYTFDPKAFADGKDFRTMRRERRRCRRKATETRPAWRWGDKDKDEPAVVHFDAGLCRWCADARDEAAAELEVEARIS